MQSEMRRLTSARSVVTHRGVVLPLLLLLLLSSHCAKSDFLDYPEVKWTYQLPSSSSSSSANTKENKNRIVQGNAVTVSPDGSLLYVTQADGRLHIVPTGDASRTLTFESSSSNCTSGVAFALSASSTLDHDFVIYAVIDDSTSSRIIAVDKNAQEVWSVSVNGEVVGTPYVSGNRVYVVYNANENGFITVIEFDPVEQTAEEIATIPDPSAASDSTTSLNSLGLLGPPAGRRVVIDGNSNEERDVVVVALAPDGNAFDAQGALYALVPSQSYDDLQGRGAEAYELRIISSYPFRSSLRPAFDGTNCYLAHYSRLSGWEGNRAVSGVLDGSEEDLLPSFENRMSSSSNDDATSTFPTTPILSADSKYLIISTSAPSVSCYDTESESTSWNVKTEGINLAEPIVTAIPDAQDVVVYVIQATNGVVRQYDVLDGNLNWEFGCSVVTGDDQCDLSVEADFSMSSSGNTLYYSFTNGTIVALSVASFPTEPPTAFPTTEPEASPTVAPEASPTVAPEASPTVAPAVSATRRPAARPTKKATAAPFLRGGGNTTSSNMTVSGDNNSSSPEANSESTQEPHSSSSNNNSNTFPLSLPVVLGVAAGGLVVLIALAILCGVCGKRKRVLQGEKEQAQKELEAARKWNHEKQAYEKECNEREQETLKEIVKTPLDPVSAKPAAITPALAAANAAANRRRSNSNGQKATTPLDSIAEDADCDENSTFDFSISEQSAEPTVTADDDLKPRPVKAASRMDPVSSLLGPIDLESMGEPDSLVSARKADIAPLVRNLSEEFIDVVHPALETVNKSAESERGSDTVSHMPRDPEITEHANSITNSSVHAEVVRAVQKSRQSKRSDASVLSQESSEAGYLPAPYLVDDDIVRRTKSPKLSAVGLTEDRSGRTSPDFSDIWSVDESLYVDEDKTVSTQGKAPSVAPHPPAFVPPRADEIPDDEPGKIAKGIRPKSPALRSLPPPVRSPTPPANRLESKSPPRTRAPSPLESRPNPLPLTAAVTKRAQSLPLSTLPVNASFSSAQVAGHPANPLPTSTGTMPTVLYESAPGRSDLHAHVAPYVRGASVRPKAGLFTRRERPLISQGRGETVDVIGGDVIGGDAIGGDVIGGDVIGSHGYIQEREAKAAYHAPRERDALSVYSQKTERDARSANDPELVATSNASVASSRASKATARISNQSSFSSASGKVKRMDTEARARNSPPSQRPSTTAGQSSAWDSFLTELAKVEDKFFNPKLGPPQPRPPSHPKRKNGGRGSSPVPSSDEDYSDDESDSDSDSGSAGLNPVDRLRT